MFAISVYNPLLAAGLLKFELLIPLHYLDKTAL